MAIRPVWLGHLRLALVGCPIALHSVVRSNSERHFHFIDPKARHRVRMVTLDSATDEEVVHRDLVTGYEIAKDRYLLLDDEDFEQARIETSSTMTVGNSVGRASIDPMWFDTSYYVAPDGEAGREVSIVLRDALRDSGRAALSRVVIASAQWRSCPCGKGMVCHTLYELRELYDPKLLFDSLPAKALAAEMMRLAEQLIERQIVAFAPEDTEDLYRARLREVIDARLHGERITPYTEEESSRDNVIHLMAALTASLNRTESTRTAQRRHAIPARKGRATRTAPTRHQR